MAGDDSDVLSEDTVLDILDENDVNFNAFVPGLIDERMELEQKLAEHSG